MTIFKQDLITLEVIRYALQAIVEEGAFTLERACESQLLREAQDFSVGLCNPDGDLLSVSLTAPSQIGMIPAVLRSVVTAYEGEIGPGDVFAVNDPYHGGSHLNDIHVIAPIFWEGDLLGFATTKAHHSDVGGKVPGSMSFDNTEIYQDGVRIPPTKLVEAGTMNRAVIALLRLNVRDPDTLMADLEAQRASLMAVSRGVTRLVEMYGVPNIKAYFAGLLEYGEKVAREQIATWPNGTFVFEDRLEDDGVTGNPVIVKVAITIDGDAVHVDFAGTSPQVPAAINFPPAEAASIAQLVLRCCMGGPELPNNSGLFRTVTVAVPQGSVLNPNPPAPSAERGVLIYRVGEALFGAMAQAVPQGASAAGEGGSYMMRFGGQRDDGERFFCIDLVQGTWGAREKQDGIDGAANILSNHLNTPIEVIEANYPLRVERHSLVPDSGGDGQFRGGLAIERWWRYLGKGEGFLRSRADRMVVPPYGLAGGEPGSQGSLSIVRADGNIETLPGKTTAVLSYGDLVRLQIAGGGGWGSPSLRSEYLRQKDLALGKVTLSRQAASFPERIDAANYGG